MGEDEKGELGKRKGEGGERKGINTRKFNQIKIERLFKKVIKIYQI